MKASIAYHDPQMATAQHGHKRSIYGQAKDWVFGHPAELIQFGLLIVAILGVLATYLQLRQNDANLRLSQRPWVGLAAFPAYEVVHAPDGSGRMIPKIRFTWKNFGPTPALHVVGVPFKAPADQPLSPDVACKHVHALATGSDPETGPLTGKMGTTLFPGQDTEMSDPGDDVPMPDNWATAPRWFSIVGCVAYEDQFGQQMETRTCHIVLPIRDADPLIKPCAAGTGVK